MKYVIAEGANVRYENGSGWSALYCATGAEGLFRDPGDDRARIEVASFLIANGADVNADTEGSTPLHSAAHEGNSETVVTPPR